MNKHTYFKFFSRCFLTLIIIMSLSACASTQLGTALSIHSAKYLNPDINGQPAPVVLSIYQLKKPFRFNNADYGSLISHGDAVLGSNLIDKQTVEIRPSTTRIIKLKLTKNTRYIGVAAEFRNINSAKWHQTIKIPISKKNIRIVIQLESEGLKSYISQ